MKVLLATDSFKDALPAAQVCQAIANGLRTVDPTMEIISCPLADGGEGTAEVLTFHQNGTFVTCLARDPLLRNINASYGISEDETTAFIDMAQASGLQLLKTHERDPMKSSTAGTGDLILDALKKGVKKIFLGIGGSATNDCGMGMAHALGYRFFNNNGQELAPIGKNLSHVRRIEKDHLLFNQQDLDIRTLCDVNNPLYGPNGAAAIYAPQKGANEEMVKVLDLGLRHFSEILKDHFHRDFSQIPGAGAAGGMGAGTMAFLGARLTSGIETILRLSNLSEKLSGSDLLITGEGKIDGQTASGKLIQGVSRLCNRSNVPVIALCGTLSATPQQIEDLGLLAAFSISDQPQDLESALSMTALSLEKTANQVIKVFTYHQGNNRIK